MKIIWKWAKLSALLLVFTIFFTGTALAQGPEEESAHLSGKQAIRIETRLAKRRDVCVSEGNGKLIRRRKQLKQRAERLLLQSLRLTAKSVDMNILGLLREFEAGNSLAEIALRQGKSLDDIADTLYNAGAEKVERSLANGKLTQNQADKILARLTKRRDACANEGQCLPLPGAADKK